LLYFSSGFALGHSRTLRKADAAKWRQAQNVAEVLLRPCCALLAGLLPVGFSLLAEHDLYAGVFFSGWLSKIYE
jgi:hypothetical protein